MLRRGQLLRARALAPLTVGVVFLAYRNQSVQVEVYDHDRGLALSMIRSGTIAPVRCEREAARLDS